jgi:hypothetical protein
MSQLINIPNYESNNLYAMTHRTRLDGAVIIGATTLTVENTADYTIGDTILIGMPGAETSETSIIQSITGGNTITITTPTKLAHERYEYINGILGTQINLYRALNVNGLQPPDTSFTLLNSTNIFFDGPTTQCSDPSGSDAYWYKYTYANPAKSVETSLADSRSARGGGTGDYCSIDSIRLEAGFKTATYITDAMIDEKRRAAEDEINATLQGFYTVPFVHPVNPFISDICVRLAAGMLLLEQYGTFKTANTGNGSAKVSEARADLQTIATKQKELTDTNGQSLALAGSTGGASVWPNETTDGTAYDGGGSPRLFRMSDIQGYYGRKF